MGFQPRDGKLHPEAVPLPASLAPGFPSEAQMQVLKTLSRGYFDSRHLTDWTPPARTQKGTVWPPR